MFVVSLSYTCELSEIENYLAEHLEYLERYYADGTFLASGRKVPRTGGVIIAQADSREILEQILLEDPFKINGLAAYEVVEFVPTKTSESLHFLRE